METNSRFCEVSTYAQSSGYSSSNASISLNLIDDDRASTNSEKPIDNNNNSETKPPTVTKLIITITLLRVDEKVKEDSRKLIDKAIRLSRDFPRVIIRFD